MIAAADRELALDVIAAANELLDLQLVVGTTGNVSVRSGAWLWITPTRTPYRGLRAGDLACVEVATGRTVGAAVPSRELAAPPRDLPRSRGRVRRRPHAQPARDGLELPRPRPRPWHRGPALLRPRSGADVPGAAGRLRFAGVGRPCGARGQPRRAPRRPRGRRGRRHTRPRGHARRDRRARGARRLAPARRGERQRPPIRAAFMNSHRQPRRGT